MKIQHILYDDFFFSELFEKQIELEKLQKVMSKKKLTDSNSYNITY